MTNATHIIQKISPKLHEIFPNMQFIYIIWLAFGIFVKIWIFIAIGLIKLVFQLVDYLRSLFLRLASLHYFAFGNRIYKFLFTKNSRLMRLSIVGLQQVLLLVGDGQYMNRNFHYYRTFKVFNGHSYLKVHIYISDFDRPYFK